MDIRILRCNSPASTSVVKQHLPELNALINDAYDAQDRSVYGTAEMFPSHRIKSHDQLVHELGDSGVAAVAFEIGPRNQTSPGDGEPQQTAVAIASLKPWTGRASKLWKPQGSEAEKIEPNDWEVAFCASKKDPQYRGQGWVTKCLAAALQEVQAINPGTINLWVTALEGVGNVEYWQRRGFIRQGEPDDAPAGTWGSTGPFKIGTLKKIVA